MKNRMVKVLALTLTASMVLFGSMSAYAEEDASAVEETVEEAVDAVEDAVDEAEAEVAEAEAAVEDAVDVAEDAADEAVEEAEGEVEEAIEAVEENAEDVAEEAEKDADGFEGLIGEAAAAAPADIEAAIEGLKDKAESVQAEVEEGIAAVSAQAEEAKAAVEEAAGQILEVLDKGEEFEDTGVPAETPGEVYEPSVDPAAPKDQAILVVSFGTSYNDSRTNTIKAVEDAIAAANPEYDVRRAFTAQIIIDKLAKRDNVVIDNFGEAIERAIADGVKTLVVQPTHLMNGYEYNDVIAELAEYEDAFEKVVVGAPLLTTDEDFAAVCEAITAETKDFDDGQTAICFMGHGTEAESNQVYEKFQGVLKDGGFENYYIGTVEAEPSLEDVIAAVGEGEYKKVVLEPLMVVAGDHANNDMAGDEEGSWKTEFEAAGYEVDCQLKGLGEMAAIRDLYVAHVAEAIASLAE